MTKEEIFKVLYGKEKLEVYHQFQAIERNIEDSDKLYQYIDDIKDMLVNEKSYIRVRGFRIICQLARHDKDNKISPMLNLLLNELDDDKPTAVRQCLNAISNLLLYKPELKDQIEQKLNQIDYSKYQDTMSPLIKKDIEYILNHL